MLSLRNALLAALVGLSLTACNGGGGGGYGYNPYAGDALIGLGAVLMQGPQPTYQAMPLHCQSFRQGVYTNMNCY